MTTCSPGRRRRLVAMSMSAAFALGALVASPAQSQAPSAPKRPPSGERHAPHATPKGWKFTLPRGDAARGRDVFVKLECYSCHEVAGEKFPAVSDQARVGPELASMATHHPAEFFAEAIVNPSAVIDKRAWSGPDGSSKMPAYNDVMTVQELVDLVAYLKALKPPGGAGGHHHRH